MRKLNFFILFLSLSTASNFFTYQWGWSNGKGQTPPEAQLPEGAIYGEPTCKPSHHYQFQQNGASIYRFDLDTGEACMIKSNQIDNWILGRCPVNEIPIPPDATYGEPK